MSDVRYVFLIPINYTKACGVLFSLSLSVLIIYLIMLDFFYFKKLQIVSCRKFCYMLSLNKLKP